MAKGSGEDKYKFEILSYLLSCHFYPVLSEVAEGSDKDKLQLFVTFPLGSGSTRAPQVESVKRPPFTSTGHFECFQKSGKICLQYHSDLLVLQILSDLLRDKHGAIIILIVIPESLVSQ